MRFLRPPSRAISLFTRSNSSAQTPGVFGLAGLHRPSDWLSIASRCADDCLSLADRIRRHEPSRNPAVLQTFDDLSDRLCRVLDAAELCRNVHPDQEFVHAANDAFVQLSEVIQHLNADHALYEPLNVLYHENEDARRGDEGFLRGEDAVMVRSLKSDFERGGIHLPGPDKRRLIELQSQASVHGADFVSSHAERPPRLDLPEAKLRQVPPSVRRRFEESLKPQHVRVGVDATTGQALLKWVSDSRVRERVYRAMHGHCAEGKLAALDRLLGERKEMAAILGHDSYAHLMFGDRLASSPGEVEAFLARLSRLVSERGQRDRNAIEIEKLRVEPHVSEGEGGVHGWDRSFYIGRLKSQDFDLSSAEVSNYFPLSACLAGLADMVRTVFGVTMTHVKPERGELWHEDVEKVLLADENGAELGYIFLDLYPREGKYGHAAHFAIRGGRQPASQKEYQTPVVALVCNFGKGVSSRDDIRLTISENECLWHEAGHCIHSILSRTRYQHLSGTRVPTDFVEVPSHLFENFVWDPRIISRFARHHSTGDPMPTRLVRALCASRKGFMATDIEMQLLFSAMDLRFHGSDPPMGQTTSTFEALQKELTSYQPDRGVPIPATFHHFVGYGAGYYSYIFARVISAQLSSHLFSSDPLSREGGLKIRNGILAYGGARDPASLLRNVLNHDVSCVPFLESTGIDVYSHRGLSLPMSKPKVG